MSAGRSAPLLSIPPDCIIVRLTPLNIDCMETNPAQEFGRPLIGSEICDDDVFQAADDGGGER